jgi:hypothetical protein
MSFQLASARKVKKELRETTESGKVRDLAGEQGEG